MTATPTLSRAPHLLASTQPGVRLTSEPARPVRDWCASWIAALLPRRVIDHAMGRVVAEAQHGFDGSVNTTVTASFALVYHVWRHGPIERQVMP